MHDQLTANDLEQMRKELDYRRITLRPQLLEEVKTARAFGDLSENFEYKAAKRDKNKNESRIRYLERMIETAHVIEDRSAADEVGLFDKVTVWFDEDEEEDVFQIVTTVKEDALRNRISNVSPAGKALLGHRVGDTVTVRVNDSYSYPLTIRAIEKQSDDGSIQISEY
ncbi:MAG: transcription elongation factor GreA [Clostridiales bacterium]|nr:transcription elongation factor GreA [Clostridiales bacterium]MCD7754303.1 transcription elongation factor GreA [Clostridiales bacterium]MCD7880728.1 transcription elongation factor GreA [Clostridiales bacterium]MCD8383449.1 transcription elongation factor GreA [Clostridiales bacterium]